ncbi:MAG: hypothetical protein P4L28_02250 [Paludibacteraceae bacterium]|nr:hypothetical protein [Paludibacteraceae bacterium]
MKGYRQLIKLNLYNLNEKKKDNISFYKMLIKNSLKGFLTSFFFIIFLLLIDSGARHITLLLCESKSNTLNSIAAIIHLINNTIGFKVLDFFKDEIVIVAGVLGVLLGLFYTVIISVLSSKYRNVDTTISELFLQQKIIKRYLKYLSFLVSTAILFQFVLILGYQPTLLSASIFTILTVFAILSFIYFGSYSLRYFDASNLIIDALDVSIRELFKTHKFNSKTKSSPKSILLNVKRNLNKIEIIIDDSLSHGAPENDIFRYSDNLKVFAQIFNKNKHLIPSNQGQHLQQRIFRRWDKATEMDYRALEIVGMPIISENIDDHCALEKSIIDIQFKLINNELENHKKVDLLANQQEYLQVLAFQCSKSLYEYFFGKLYITLRQKIEQSQKESEIYKIELSSVYTNLVIQYFVGFNYNISKIITVDSLKKLASNINIFKSINKGMPFPYELRVWIDAYQEALSNEKYLEGKFITPLFYTEYKLAQKMAQILKSHIIDISNFTIETTEKFIKYLIENKLYLEATIICLQSLEINQKINSFSKTVDKINDNLNLMSLAQEKKFEFLEINEITRKNNLFKVIILDNLWVAGLSAYKVNDVSLPDVFGNV